MNWLGHLWLNSRRPARLGNTPANLAPAISGDELETTKVTRILSAAVVSAAVLATVMGLRQIK